MIACPSCARENPAEFAFCPACGTQLTAEQPSVNESKTLAEERKVVSILFCDLVSYTAHSEASDHELIDALLQQYNALARRLVEGHGGVVEKFIGDAVLAVFGFPAAHDDDAERAVRCALKLASDAATLAWPDGDPAEVRIGVNTGETYLHTDVDPASGETFLTGDAVNSAARLETAAPPGGVVVGELTHSLTATTITYEQLPPLTLKGKAEPVPAWLTKGVREDRSRTGLRTTGKLDTPFLGREVELRALEEAFDAAASTNEAQFRLIVGEPGIGKSRLVLEFARALEARPELITWRQGRCLAYGDASGIAALADVVKAHAGILDSDDLAAVEEKLEAILPQGEDRAWLRQRLRPLLGLEAALASQEENFAAWTRFLTHLASSGSTVLVLEDLHWAGEGLLTFIEHLATHEFKVPLLVLATARPELLSGHPDVLETAERITRLDLSALSRKEVSRLVSALLDERPAAEVREPILERAGGNPLYAEEFVRLLLDRGLLVKVGRALRLRADQEVPLPDTVQAVLAARLDTLPVGQKALLCDAAVFGESFWGGGLIALGDRTLDEVSVGLAALVERQLIRPVVSTALDGESEHIFWHALTSEVAYAQLPKRVRARKHSLAADWLEAKAGERVQEFAQVLAHHTVTSMELSLSLGDTDAAAELRGPAARNLALAGDHAMRLDVVAAERFYARASDLASDEDSARARVVVKWADALHACMRDGEAIQLLEEAVSVLRCSDDRRLLALALVALSRARISVEAPGIDEPAAEALAVVDDDPSPELVRVLTFTAGYLALEHEDSVAAVEMADRALLVASQLGLPVDVLALGARATGRSIVGDRRTLDDYRQAVEEAQTQGLAVETCQLQFHLGIEEFYWVGPGAQILWMTRALQLARRCGSQRWAANARQMTCEAQLSSGDWDELLTETARLVAVFKGGGNPWLSMPYALQVLVSADRGTDDVLGDNQSWLEAWASEGPLDDRPLCVAPLVALALRRCHLAQALDLLENGLPADATNANLKANLGTVLTRLARTAVTLGRPDLAVGLMARIDLATPFHQNLRCTVAAMVGEADGELNEAAAGFADAAARWHGFSMPYEEAQALLGQGRCLTALGRAPEAAAPLAAAREVFIHLGAKPALAETDALLASVSG